MGSQGRRLGTIIAMASAMAGGVACSGGTLIAVGPRDATTSDRDAMAAETPAGTTLSLGLVGLWHLDQHAGDTVVVDSSGNGNDGTLMQIDPSTAWVAGGRVGNALALEGLGYVRVPPSDSIASIVSGVTISAWVYLEGTIDHFGTALSRQIGSSVDQYYHLSLWLTGGKVNSNLFITPDGGAARPYSPVAGSPNSWTHLAGTYDGKVATLYVDGAQVASAQVTGTFPLDSTPIILGGNGNDASETVSEFFPGRLDEIALYNRGLDASEIQQLYSAAPF